MAELLRGVCDLVQPARIPHSDGPHAWLTVLLEAILKFVMMLSFGLRFVSEVQWDKGAGMCSEERDEGCPSALSCSFIHM